jgi:Fe2+ transport system protein FeoA
VTPPNPFRSADKRAVEVRIADLARGAKAVVVGHGTDAATAERLSALGLGLGARFTVMQPGKSATVLVGESRIGLGPELSCAVRALRR